MIVRIEMRKIKALTVTLIFGLFCMSATSAGASQKDCYNEVTDSPSSLQLAFCASDLSNLSEAELEKISDNDFQQDTTFKISYKIIKEIEDWTIVSFKENETEYLVSGFIGLNCASGELQGLHTNSLRLNRDSWTLSFGQYASALYSVCGFAGNLLDKMDGYNYCHALSGIFRYCGTRLFDHSRDVFSLTILKKLEHAGSDTSIWSSEFWQEFQTYGCVECGSSAAEVIDNRSTLADDVFKFLVLKHQKVLKLLPNVTLNDLKSIKENDFESLTSFLENLLPPSTLSAE